VGWLGAEAKTSGGVAALAAGRRCRARFGQGRRRSTKAPGVRFEGARPRQQPGGGTEQQRAMYQSP